MEVKKNDSLTKESFFWLLYFVVVVYFVVIERQHACDLVVLQFSIEKHYPPGES